MWPLRLPGGGMDGVLRARRRRCSSACSTSRTRPPWSACRPAARRARRLGARRDRRDVRRGGDRAACASRSASTTTCAPFYDRFRDDPLIGPSVRARPASARAPAPGAVRGAGVGDLRAAHRVRARRGDRAADRLRALGRRCPRTGLRDLPGGRDARRRRRRRCCSPSTSSAGRALALRRAAREVAAGPRRPARARPRARLAAAARDPGHRLAGRSRCSPCTARAATTSSRPATSAYIKLVGRAADRRPPARAGDRGRGARVLRALRGLGRPRRRCTRSLRGGGAPRAYSSAA